MERNVLGRGLSALIPETDTKEKIQQLPVDKIVPSAFQPRKHFPEPRLRELASSIQERGVIQPVLVRPQGERFELIAGERRWRAVQILGLKEIPAIVRSVQDRDLLELSLIENIQREELNRIEEAHAYERLAREFGLTHEFIAQRVAKDRATVTNTLRLLELPAKVQKFLEENAITMGHARCLLALSDPKRQAEICERIVRTGMSVRQAEAAVKRESSPRRIFRSQARQDVHVAAAEESLQHHLGTRVKILRGKKRGKIVIDFFSPEDLGRLLDLLLPRS
jgi:ParB family chromosome partitioning protein